MEGKLPKPPKGYKLVPEGTPGPKHANTLYLRGGSGGYWDAPMIDGSEYYKGHTYAVPVSVVFPEETPKAPRKAPKLQETSLQAHESQKDKAPLDRVAILARLRKYRTGTTCDKLEQVLNMSHQTTSARINDLVRLGKVVDSGRREKTRTGRLAICWKAVA